VVDGAKVNTDLPTRRYLSYLHGVPKMFQAMLGQMSANWGMVIVTDLGEGDKFGAALREFEKNHSARFRLLTSRLFADEGRAFLDPEGKKHSLESGHSEEVVRASTLRALMRLEPLIEAQARPDQLVIDTAVFIDLDQDTIKEEHADLIQKFASSPDKLLWRCVNSSDGAVGDEQLAGVGDEIIVRRPILFGAYGLKRAAYRLIPDWHAFVASEMEQRTKSRHEYGFDEMVVWRATVELFRDRSGGGGGTRRGPGLTREQEMKVRFGEAGGLGAPSFRSVMGGHPSLPGKRTRKRVLDALRSTYV
jgi:hypothetical protein